MAGNSVASGSRIREGTREIAATEHRLAAAIGVEERDAEEPGPAAEACGGGPAGRGGARGTAVEREAEGQEEGESQRDRGEGDGGDQGVRAAERGSQRCFPPRCRVARMGAAVASFRAESPGGGALAGRPSAVATLLSVGCTGQGADTTR